MEYIKICVIEGIRRRRRYRHRRIILRRNLMRQNVVPPSPEVPPPSYDSDSKFDIFQPTVCYFGQKEMLCSFMRKSTQKSRKKPFL